MAGASSGWAPRTRSMIPATPTSTSSSTAAPTGQSRWTCGRDERRRLMARAQPRYVCQECGTAHAKWVGKCEGCGAWNSLVEEASQEAPPKGLGGKGLGKTRAVDFVALRGAVEPTPRRISGIAEFDRACGGGMVAGSALLVGGDPGIGKSTLLLQVVAALARGPHKDGPGKDADRL